MALQAAPIAVNRSFKLVIGPRRGAASQANLRRYTKGEPPALANRWRVSTHEVTACRPRDDNDPEGLGTTDAVASTEPPGVIRTQEDLRSQGPRRERIHEEIVPIVQKSTHPQILRIVEGREIKRASVNLPRWRTSRSSPDNMCAAPQIPLSSTSIPSPGFGWAGIEHRPKRCGARTI